MKFNVTIAYPSPLIAAGSLFFNGTAVWLRGAGIPTKIPYTVNLDSVEYNFVSGQLSPDSLFWDTTTANVEHNVRIQPASILDTVVIEMDLGDQADAIMSLDDSMLFQEEGFTTKGQWTMNECLGSGRAAGTCHVSEGTGSEFSYEFEGDAVTVWGSVEDVNSFYTVSIDGLQPTSYSPPNTTSSRPITVLAHASNLGAGSHTLTLTSQPKDGKSRVEIDSVQLYAKTTSGSSTVPSGSSSGTSIVGASAASDSSGGLSRTAKIAIIGGIICGVILLGALVTFILLMRRRNARAAAHSRNPTTHASGIRVDIKTGTRDDDEETLAGSVKDLKKDGIELGPLESQTRLPPRW